MGSNKYSYKVEIFFDSTQVELITKVTSAYKFSIKDVDSLTVFQNKLEIIASRSSNIDLDYIFYNYKSSLRDQIIKSLVFYYSLIQPYQSIRKVEISKFQSGKVLLVKRLKGDEIFQPLVNTYTHHFHLDMNKVKLILDESEKSRSMLLSVSYLHKAICSQSETQKFERLWKSFNRLYMLIGRKNNDHDCHVVLRSFLIKHETRLKYSKERVSKFNKDKLRNSFQWRSLILNDYEDLSKTKAFHDFILRYTDKRVIDLFEELLPYRAANIVAKGLQVPVQVHIGHYLANPVKVDAELISLLCIKYMYFVRNKTFHGERIDETFNLISTKENAEFIILNELLSALIVDLINMSDLY